LANEHRFLTGWNAPQDDETQSVAARRTDMERWMSYRLAILTGLIVVTAVEAGGEERRIFSVTVDRRQGGTNQIVIQSRDDGSTVVTSQADVTVKVAFVTYRYSFRGTEVYKEGKLVKLSSTTNDDGKKHAVSGEASKEGLALTVDGKNQQIKGEPWLTTYWQLPPEGKRGPNVTLLDADTGKIIAAKMEKIGVEKIAVLGKGTECVHYRLTGGVQVDLWYDGADRMVRQEMVEDGHRTIMELSRFQRD
jgi:hypothetical protein